MGDRSVQAGKVFPWDLNHLLSSPQDPTMSAEQPQTLEATWERLRKLTLRLDAHFEIRQKLEVGKQYATEHPIVTMMALLTLAFCSVPLICFIGFAVVTFIFTFIGFLFVEGE
jgi:hypothetical protein